MKIKKFSQINEIFGFNGEFYNRFNKKEEPKKLNRIDACILDIIDFLKDNKINNWTEFTTTGRFERWAVDKIIDSNCETKEDLEEVKYKLKLNLSDLEQLNSMLKEYEDMEEYEKCSEIQKEIENKTI